MKAKKKMLLSSIMVIALCLSLIAGSTFALFTSESKVNIAVTSGKVDVVATLSEPSLYSVEPDANGNLEIKTGLGAGFYSYSPLSGSTFLNGGTATLSGGTLTISRITPGDKITTTLGITNKSNVTVQYRVLVTVEEEAHANTARLLTEAMVLSMQAESATKATEYTGLKTYTSAWEKISPVGAGSPDNIDDIDIALWLPVETGNDYQDLEDLSVTFTVEAVQGNASVSGVETYETVTATVENYSDFETAIQTVNTTTDPVTRDTIAADTELTTTSEEANITVNVVVPSTLSFTSENDDTVTVTETSTVELQVSNVSMSADKDTAQETVSLDVKLLVDGKEVENANQAVTVTLNIGTGKDITSFTHNGEPVDNYSYSAQTGILTFTTTGFSPFEYTYSVVAPAAKLISDGIETYYYTVDNKVNGIESVSATLLKAISDAKDGDTIKLFPGTIELGKNGEDLDINKNISIEGAVDENGKPTTNLVIYGRGNEYYARILMRADGCSISNLSVSSTYGLKEDVSKNMSDRGQSSVYFFGNTVTINNCVFDGWDRLTYKFACGNLGNITINDSVFFDFNNFIYAYGDYDYTHFVNNGNFIMNRCSVSNTATYGLHADDKGSYELNDCDLMFSWVSFGNEASAVFNNCTLRNGGYEHFRAYQSTSFNNCIFEEGITFDYGQVGNIVYGEYYFTNCVYGNEELTLDSYSNSLSSNFELKENVIFQINGTEIH